MNEKKTPATFITSSKKNTKILDNIASSFSQPHGFNNTQMRLGASDDGLSQSEWVYNRNFLNWKMWTTMYETSWVFRNGIDMKANASVTDISIETSGATPSEIDQVVLAMRRLSPDMKHLVGQGMVYGGAAAAILIDDVLDDILDGKSLDMNKIKKGSKISLYIRDRWNGLSWEGKATFSAIGTSDFNKPMTYVFSMVDDDKTEDKNDHANMGENENQVNIHHDYVLRCENRKPTKYTSYQLNGWGLPEGHHLLQELQRDATTRATIASLVKKSLIEVFHMAGIRGLFSGMSGMAEGDNSGATAEMQARLESITRFRDINNASFLDKEDEYKQFQFSAFAGLADILHQQRKATSGAMQIPEMLIYMSADQKGLIFTDDGPSPEIEVFQTVITDKQDKDVRPIMDKILPIVWKATLGTDIPDDISYTFLPIFQESKKMRMDRAEVVVDMVTSLVEGGIISPQMAAIEIKEQAKSTGFGTNFTDEYINTLPDKTIDIYEEGDNDDDNNSNNDNKETKTKTKVKDYKIIFKEGGLRNVK